MNNLTKLQRAAIRKKVRELKNFSKFVNSRACVCEHVTHVYYDEFLEREVDDSYIEATMISKTRGQLTGTFSDWNEFFNCYKKIIKNNQIELPKSLAKRIFCEY